MARTLRFEIVIPNVPDWMPSATVEGQLDREISHPYDSAYDADIEIYLSDEEEIEE